MASDDDAVYHEFVEEELCSTYDAKIRGHNAFVNGECGKLLVEWVENIKNGSNETESSSSSSRQSASSSSASTTPSRKGILSWVKVEEFVLPLLALSYLEETIKKDKSISLDERLRLREIRTMVEQIQQKMEKQNSVEDMEGRMPSLYEIAFCCFLCQCKDTRGHSGNVKLDGFDMKYHRECCHGLDDEAKRENFRSPLGRVLEASDKLMEAGEESLVTGKTPKDASQEEDESSSTLQQQERLRLLYERDCKEWTDKRVMSACREETKTQNDEMLPCPVNMRWSDDSTKNAMNKFQACRKDRLAHPERKREAVVLDVFGGIGCSLVVLKRLGVAIKKAVHIDHDRVAQHVYRYNHDASYGGVASDDGIEHICGLYETFDELQKGLGPLVRQHGPIDIVTGGPPCQDHSAVNAKRQGFQSESGNLMRAFAVLIKDVERFNKEYHDFDDLVFLCENVPGATTDAHGVSAFRYDAKSLSPTHRDRIFYINYEPDALPEDDPVGGTKCLKEGWMTPVMFRTMGIDTKVRTLMASWGRIGDPATMYKVKEKEGVSRKPGEEHKVDDGIYELFDTSDRERLMGLPVGYVENAIVDIFKNLREAFLVGLDPNKFWRDVCHPKYWGFLALGPNRHRFRLRPEYELGDPERFSLAIKDPNSKDDFYTEYEYAWHLIGNGFSIPQVEFLMKPLQDLFQSRVYAGYAGVSFAWEEDEASQSNVGLRPERAPRDETKHQDKGDSAPSLGDEDSVSSSSTEPCPKRVRRSEPQHKQEKDSSASSDDEQSIKSNSSTSSLEPCPKKARETVTEYKGHRETAPSTERSAASIRPEKAPSDDAEREEGAKSTILNDETDSDVESIDLEAGGSIRV